MDITARKLVPRLLRPRVVDEKSIGFDDRDALVFWLATDATPVFSELAAARYAGHERYMPPRLAQLRDELVVIRGRLESERMNAWPADGPRITAADLEHLIATCRRLADVVDAAIAWNGDLCVSGD